jgi:hypothetical protein
MNSCYIEVQPMPYKKRINRRSGIFFWGMGAQLVVSAILALYTHNTPFFIIWVVAVSGLTWAIIVQLIFTIKAMKFYLVSLKIDSFNKVYLTFDFKGETKTESYELKDFNLIIQEVPTRNINYRRCTMTLINQSKKIHVQHVVGDWNKEKYFEVSKAVSDLKYQKK